MQALNSFHDILFVSLGAVFGANLRYIIYQKFKERNVNVYLIILAINIFSSFLLGLFISILPKVIFLNISTQLILLLSIGFSGSLSTFSSFAYDLFESIQKFKLYMALKSLILSFSLGTIALAMGFLLGN